MKINTLYFRYIIDQVMRGRIRPSHIVAEWVQQVAMRRVRG